ncbi:MAG: hypothetical protein K2G29_04395, partial [Muribaculaceae bacterium]|nr:hypothetical protein [Muribaculaceae bacterium]
KYTTLIWTKMEKFLKFLAKSLLLIVAPIAFMLGFIIEFFKNDENMPYVAKGNTGEKAENESDRGAVGAKCREVDGKKDNTLGR